MIPVFSQLERMIEQHGTYFRLELASNLNDVLHSQKKEILSFATNNIDLSLGSGLNTQEIGLVPLCFSAVYFANARYFEYDIYPDSEYVRIVVTAENGPATHGEIGLYEHLIEIPFRYTAQIEDLFFALDAESRHTIHQNILQEKDLFEKHLAPRAFNVIAEAIDEGEPHRIRERSPHYDPFLEDFQFAPSEEDGHNGAKYLCRHLSAYPDLRRKQLYWLSRQAVRSYDEDPDSDNREIIPAKGIRSLYTHGISVLEKFYAGKLRVSGRKSEQVMNARQALLEHNPYFPGDDVELNGRKIDCFASQLDYIVLKLAKTEPDHLYQEAKV